jgi:hypothetical protein
MSPVWMFASKFSRYASLDSRLNQEKFDRDRYDLFDLLAVINKDGAEELARLEKMLGEVILFNEEVERKLQELVDVYNRRV